MSRRPLTWLVSELGRSLRDAQAAIDEHHIRGFYDQSNDPGGPKNKPRPRTVGIPLPAGDGTYEIKQVAIASLSRHNALALEEVTVKASVTLFDNEKTDGLDIEVGRRPSEEEGEGEGSRGEFTLTFRRQDAPEGIGRIAQHLQSEI